MQSLCSLCTTLVARYQVLSSRLLLGHGAIEPSTVLLS